jgi:hypothetical protein
VRRSRLAPAAAQPPGIWVSVGAPAAGVLPAEDVLVGGGEVVAGGVVVGGVVAGEVVAGGVVVGVDVGVVVVGGVVAATGGVVTGVVVTDVTGGEVACSVGAVEGVHVGLTGSGPTSPDGATFGLTEFAAPAFVPAATVPLEWRVVVVPPELWSRHRVLPAGMVARNGFPGMCVVVWLPTGAPPFDWAPPAPPPLELGPERLPNALSSCAVTCWRSRGIESVTAITRSRAVALASTGRTQMPGVRST